MPIAEALATDFEAAFRHALKSFAKDADVEYPNRAQRNAGRPLVNSVTSFSKRASTRD